MTIYEFFPVPPKACCLLCRRRVGSLPSRWQFPSVLAVSLCVGSFPLRRSAPVRSGASQFAPWASAAWLRHEVSVSTVPRRHPRKPTATFSVVFPLVLSKMYQENVLGGTKLIRANQIGCHCCGRRSDSSAQVLRNSRPGHPPPSATTPAEMNWPVEFLDDLAGVCIIIIERNRLRANKMRK